MYKHRGMKKCNVLLGDVRSLNTRHIERLKKKLDDHCSPSERKKMFKSLKYWKEVDEKYEISLEEV